MTNTELKQQLRKCGYKGPLSNKRQAELVKLLQETEDKVLYRTVSREVMQGASLPMDPGEWLASLGEHFKETNRRIELRKLGGAYCV